MGLFLLFQDSREIIADSVGDRADAVMIEGVHVVDRAPSDIAGKQFQMSEDRKWGMDPESGVANHGSFPSDQVF